MPEIVPLSRDHDRAGFDCGVKELNSFLKVTARQHGDKGISRTFVLSEQESPAIILGYFTLTLCEVRTEDIPTAYSRGRDGARPSSLQNLPFSMPFGGPRSVVAAFAVSFAIGSCF